MSSATIKAGEEIYNKIIHTYIYSTPQPWSQSPEDLRMASELTHRDGFPNHVGYPGSHRLPKDRLFASLGVDVLKG